MSMIQKKNFFPSVFKKLSLSIGFIAVSMVYALSLRSGSTPVVVTPPEVSPSQSYKEASSALLQTLSQITGSTTPSSAPVVPTPAQTKSMMQPMMPTNMGLYKNGSYIGSTIDAYYGFVQVKAIVQSGKISDVQFLQYPNDRSNSREINSQAMPLLKQEAIQAQNAQVNGVSGATFTSEAFIQSLSSALALAKN